MTRKDFEALARALRDATYGMEASERDGWRLTVIAVANACHVRGGFDVNGNRKFDRERFYAAAGLVDR